MKILALIIARSGSKRIPRKNAKILGGKPLIVWSIDVVKNVDEICNILVSTDDEGIAQIARNEGVMVPWLRPDELANDMTSSVDVCIHALDWYEKEHGKIDGLLLLQPTSPFRSEISIINGIKHFLLHDMNTVIGVSPAKTHPLFCFKKNGVYISPYIDNSGLHLRTQDLPYAYEVNGAFYLITPKCLRSTRSFYANNLIPLVFENFIESIDIDTVDDWQKAENYLHNSDFFIE